MDDFYEFAHITIAIVDLKGNILVSIGWQDICTRFHRVHPETCKHCVESDTKLSAGVPSGEFKLYRCKNNMWDTATPIMVGGQHVGNIFSGQFFFDVITSYSIHYTKLYEPWKTPISQSKVVMIPLSPRAWCRLPKPWLPL